MAIDGPKYLAMSDEELLNRALSGDPGSDEYTACFAILRTRAEKQMVDAARESAELNRQSAALNKESATANKELVEETRGMVKATRNMAIATWAPVLITPRYASCFSLPHHYSQ